MNSIPKSLSLECNSFFFTTGVVVCSLVDCSSISLCGSQASLYIVELVAYHYQKRGLAIRSGGQFSIIVYTTVLHYSIRPRTVRRVYLLIYKFSLQASGFFMLLCTPSTKIIFFISSNYSKTISHNSQCVCIIHHLQNII